MILLAIAVFLLLAILVSQTAWAEAAAIAALPETQHAFARGGFSEVTAEFEEHEATLRKGFALALQDGNAEASFNAPGPWTVLKSKLPLAEAAAGHPAQFT